MHYRHLRIDIDVELIRYRQTVDDIPQQFAGIDPEVRVGYALFPADARSAEEMAARAHPIAAESHDAEPRMLEQRIDARAEGRIEDLALEDGRVGDRLALANEVSCARLLAGSAVGS